MTEAEELVEHQRAVIRDLVLATVRVTEDRDRLLKAVRTVSNAVLAGGPDWMTNRDAALYDLFEILAALEGHGG